MIISVQKIKIFDLFFKNKQLSSKLAMSIFEFLSKDVKITFNLKWRRKIYSILTKLKYDWHKVERSGAKKKIFICNLLKQYFEFDLNILKQDSDIDVCNSNNVRMEIDPVSLDVLLLNLRI